MSSQNNVDIFKVKSLNHIADNLLFNRYYSLFLSLAVLIAVTTL